MSETNRSTGVPAPRFRDGGWWMDLHTRDGVAVIKVPPLHNGLAWLRDPEAVAEANESAAELQAVFDEGRHA